MRDPLSPQSPTLMQLIVEECIDKWYPKCKHCDCYMADYYCCYCGVMQEEEPNAKAQQE